MHIRQDVHGVAFHTILFSFPPQGVFQEKGFPQGTFSIVRQGIPANGIGNGNASLPALVANHTGSTAEIGRPSFFISMFIFFPST